MSKIRNLHHFIVPYTKQLMLSLFLMLCVSFFSLLNPWLAGRFTESVLGNGNNPQYQPQQILLLWFIVLVIQAVVGFSSRYVSQTVSEDMLARLRIRLYEHFQVLPLAYFHQRKSGSILALLVNDAAILSNYITGSLPGLLPQFITLLGALLMIYLIDPVIAFMVTILVPLFFLAMKIVGRKIRPLSARLHEEYGNTIAMAEENLQLIPVIKAFTRETIESDRFTQVNSRFLDIIRKYTKIQSLLSPMTGFLSAAGILLILWLSIGKLETGQLSIASVVSLLLYGMLLTRPVSNLADLYGQTVRVGIALDRISEVFALEPEPMEKGHVVAQIAGDIEFADVWFKYPGRDNTLTGVNFRINAGDTVAITGKNGAGKSTLAFLLQRFAEPAHGKILIDGQDISTINLRCLRQNIGMVQQSVLLLNGTVRENIVYGKNDATDEEITTAARLACALEFIEELPDGFDTLIGDQGIRLSGGQKQRLSLARALIKDPPVLILDEATAMFDPEGEKDFVRNFTSMPGHRTVILITHRPASLALASRVLLLEDGKIVENSGQYKQGTQSG